MVDFNKWEKESLTVIVWFMETKTECKRHKSVANLRAHKLRAHASDIEKDHLFSLDLAYIGILLSNLLFRIHCLSILSSFSATYCFVTFYISVLLSLCIANYLLTPSYLLAQQPLMVKNNKNRLHETSLSDVHTTNNQIRLG